MNLFAVKRSKPSWSNILPISVLLIVWLVIVATNTQLGTWFLGWDLMDSSFNPQLMIWRSIFGTWQSFQGLGLLGGHGYGAQLPQAIIQLLLSLIIPTMYLRYAFTFLMMLSAMLGSYSLFKYILSEKIHLQSRRVVPEIITNTLCATGAIAYIFNFGMIQNFYVPLEPFIVMAGLLPWALMSLFKLLEKPTPAQWLQFGVLNFFLSTIGFIPPVFISYFVFILVILIIQIVFSAQRRQSLQRALTIMLVILGLNFYWLAPVGFFTLTQQNDYLESQLNQNSTQDFVYKSANYGQIQNSLRLRGFLLESYDQSRFDTTKDLEPIFLPWIRHFDNPVIASLDWIIALTGLVGLIYGIYNMVRYRSVRWSISVLGILALALLTTSTPPFSWITIPLREIPVLNQAFRLPFSKISMSAALFMSFGLVVSLSLIIETVFHSQNSTRARNSSISLLAGIIFIILTIATPAFTGNFLYKGARVQMPSAYESLFSYFEAQPADDRIALFPIYTTTGWEMYDWGKGQGYTGSGFLWYAIKQPILARAFDVWNPANEKYRNQVSQAIYTQDASLFSSVLDTYGVKSVVIDDSVHLPHVPAEVFATEDIKKLLRSSSNFSLAFQEGLLTVYQRTVPITKHSSVTVVSESEVRLKADPKLSLQQTISEVAHDSGTQFPFQDINSEKISKDADITESDDAITIVKRLNIPSPATPQVPTVPLDEPMPFLIGVNTDLNQITFRPLLPTVSANGSPVFKPKDVTITFSSPLDNQNELTINGQPITLSQVADSSSASGLVVVAPQEILRVSHSNTSEIIEADLRNTANNSIDSKPQTLVGDIELRATWPKQKLVWPSVDSTSSGIENCALEKKGSVSKNTVLGGIEYTASQGGMVCEYIIFQPAELGLGYLIHVAGMTQSGSPAKVIFTNLQNKLPVIEQKLSTSAFSDWFSIQPMKNGSEGYQILFQLQSFGNDTAISKIDEVGISLIPIHFLSSITAVPTTPSDRYELATATTEGVIGTGIQFIQTNRIPDASAIISNDTAYSKGWIAFPALQPWKQYEHVRYNGWANAWIIKPAEDSSGRQRITILYWPQLLTFVGYGVLVLTLGGLAWLAWRSRRIERLTHRIRHQFFS